MRRHRGWSRPRVQTEETVSLRILDSLPISTRGCRNTAGNEPAPRVVHGAATPCVAKVDQGWQINAAHHIGTMDGSARQAGRSRVGREAVVDVLPSHRMAGVSSCVPNHCIVLKARSMCWNVRVRVDCERAVLPLVARPGSLRVRCHGSLKRNTCQRNPRD